jgi:hypothetical protein
MALLELTDSRPRPIQSSLSRESGSSQDELVAFLSITGRLNGGIPFPKSWPDQAYDARPTESRPVSPSEQSGRIPRARSRLSTRSGLTKSKKGQVYWRNEACLLKLSLFCNEVWSFWHKDLLIHSLDYHGWLFALCLRFCKVEIVVNSCANGLMVVALPPGSAGGKVGCVNNVSLKRIEIINLEMTQIWSHWC